MALETYFRWFQDICLFFHELHFGNTQQRTWFLSRFFPFDFGECPSWTRFVFRLMSIWWICLFYIVLHLYFSFSYYVISFLDRHYVYGHLMILRRKTFHFCEIKDVTHPFFKKTQLFVISIFFSFKKMQFLFI